MNATLSYAARPMRYAYSSSRTKAMKGALLSKDDMEQLISADRVGDVIAVLGRTDYKDDMTEPALRHSGADLVDFALGRHMARKARKILSFAPGEALPAVLSVLEKWDAYNLKTILLAKHLGHPNAEIVPLLVPAGAFTKDDLLRMLSQESVEGVASLITGTGYGEALEPLLAEYKKSKNIQPLLNAVEKHFYAKLSGAVSPRIPDGERILAVVRASIDNRNAVNILRGKREGASEAKIRSYVIGGGTLTAHELNRFIQAPTTDEAFKAVMERFGLTPLEPGGRKASLVNMETELERRVLRLGFRTLRMSVLSPGVLVGYLLLKENEVNNVRKIVRGKEFNLPPAKIRGTLVFAD
ncbi:MAG: V-type ATPase subunit [Candidatus ainarchaeum sp.]|nr:V-type ATPase subunit [Candidatus ainarchaeum sp.]